MIWTETPRRWTQVALTLSFGALVLFATTSAQEAEPDLPPLNSSREESVDVRLVQLDVSVIDSKGDDYASVPGLTKDHFRIRLNGEDLTEQQRESLIVDEMCLANQEPVSDQAAVIMRPMIAVIDFNYLDARGRNIVAKGLDSLAESVDADAGDHPFVYKIYGLTRYLRALTPGFVNDGDSLRAVAELVRQTAFRSKGVVVDGDDGPSEDSIPIEQFEDISFGEALVLPEAFQNLDSSRAFNDGSTNYNPTATLAAVESAMRAHAHIRGRKLMMLFTTEAFRFARKERLEFETQAIRELSREGFTLWTVNVEGLNTNMGQSDLMTSLARDSGGHRLNGTNDIGRSFTYAARQLDCYYLFSLPVQIDKTRRDYDLRVSFDTKKYPETFRYRVVAPDSLRFASEDEEEKRDRIAALIAPTDFKQPPVNATLGYPVQSPSGEILPARLRVPLRYLEWAPTTSRGFDGPVRARLLVDAIVERDSGFGRQTLCEIGAERTGEIAVNLPRLPHPESTNGLSIELNCPLTKRGLLTLRGIVTDLNAGTTGGGRSTIQLRPPKVENWNVFVPRVEAVSGGDFVWKPGAIGAKRDENLSSWRVVDRQNAATADDTLALNFVLCGPGVDAAEQSYRTLLMREEGNSLAVVQTFNEGSITLAPVESKKQFCAQAVVGLPAHSLQRGDYGFALISADEDLESLLSESAKVADLREQFDGWAPFSIR